MSTRSVVGRVAGDGFEGRYCHWDGYPTCRGAQLFDAYRELGSAEALIEYAVKPGQSGYWSSFCPPSENPVTMDRSTPEGEAEFQANIGKSNWAIEEDNFDLIQSTGDGWGTEWAYVIADNGLSVFVNGNGWELVGVYGWDAEPDWEHVEGV